MNIIKEIKKNINNKELRVGVIGLGYVGLPLVNHIIKKRYKVIGFDIDKNKLRMLNKGKSYINHISNRTISYLLKNGFVATDNWAKINYVDVIIICVPTPLTSQKTPDLSYLKATLDSIIPYFKKNQLLILESTSYPGTTKEVLLPIIENIGFVIGRNFFISYSPEREDPGNKDFTTDLIPKLISGVTSNCLEIVKTFYGNIFSKTVLVSSTETAEMAKLLENIYRAVNIGLINEMKIVSTKLGIDIYEVIEAAATKPFGFTPFYPGPGIGGHCIPIDPFYLAWKAKKIGVKTSFIEAAGEINAKMPKWVVDLTKENLFKRNINIINSKILIIGVAYKKNVDDMRESPSLKIINLLIQEGAKVDYHDPLISQISRTREYNYNLRSKPLRDIGDFDCVLILTDHDSIDYTNIVKKSNLIIDTRGRLKNNPNVIQG